GLRLPRLGVLLPENQGCLPRESAMNRFFVPASRASGIIPGLDTRDSPWCRHQMRREGRTMLDISSFQLFVLSVFLLSITPGPDMAYVVGQSIANGRRAGVISAAGVALGSCTHALFSIAGLTALIAASPCSRW